MGTFVKKLAIVSPFPVSIEPHRGTATYYQALEFAAWTEVRVFVPHPLYPDLRMLRPKSFLYGRDNFAFPTPGVAPTYITYPTLPLVGRVWNGRQIGARLIPLLAKFRPKVILAYNIYPQAYGAMLAGATLGIPVVVGALGSDLLRISGPVTKQLARQTVRRSDFMVGVSRELVDQAISLGARPDRTATIPVGVDRSLFCVRNRHSARRELGLSSEVSLIVFIGRLVPLKGVGELLEAVAAVKKHAPNTHLACVGDGPLRRDLQQFAAHHPVLRGGVRFLGTLPAAEVATWLAAADLLCLPSHSEGCPHVVMEALASGRPVVSTTVGGLPDMVAPHCGVLVPPGSPVELARALTDVLERNWDENAIARTVSRSWRDMASETYDVCCRVAEERQSS